VNDLRDRRLLLEFEGRLVSLAVNGPCPPLLRMWELMDLAGYLRSVSGGRRPAETASIGSVRVIRGSET